MPPEVDPVGFGGGGGHGWARVMLAGGMKDLTSPCLGCLGRDKGFRLVELWALMMLGSLWPEAFSLRMERLHVRLLPLGVCDCF